MDFLEDTLTIASGAAVSDKFVAWEFERGSIQTPAAFTSTVLQWQCSNDGTTWDDCRDEDGTADATVTVTTGDCYAIPDAMFSYKYGRMSVDQNEAAARTIILVLHGNR